MKAVGLQNLTDATSRDLAQSYASGGRTVLIRKSRATGAITVCLGGHAAMTLEAALAQMKIAVSLDPGDPRRLWI
jgi:hypothetical protein